MFTIKILSIPKQHNSLIIKCFKNDRYFFSFANIQKKTYIKTFYSLTPSSNSHRARCKRAATNQHLRLWETY